MKKQMVATVLTAAVSMAAGFLVVYLIVGPSGSDETAGAGEVGGGGKGETGKSVAGREAGAGSVEGTPLNVEEVEKGKAAAAGEEEKQEGEASPSPGEPTPVGGGEEPPPQARAPVSGKVFVSIDDYFVFRCWKQGEETPHQKEECGKPVGMEKLVKDHLAAVSRCAEEYAGGEKGKVSLALKVYFTSRRYRAWLGNSTTIPAVEETSACIREYYEGVAFEDMEHSFDTYLVFYMLDYNP